ncbi:MAG: Mini-ribonuclease 3 [Bacillota bacterium]
MYTDKEAGLLPPGLMAYIGDSVFELMVRKHFLKEGYRKLHDIHQQTISLVNASAQAAFLEVIKESLTQREKDIVNRGKNTKTGTVPNNADIMDYRMSTAFEALIGFLYLSEQKTRLEELWRKILLYISEKKGK